MIIIRKVFSNHNNNEEKDLAKNLIVPAGVIGTGYGLDKISSKLLKSSANQDANLEGKKIEALKKLAKESKDKGLKFVDEGENLGNNFINLRKKELHLSKFGQNSPTTIAHELGHFDSYQGENGKLQKLVHKHYHNIGKEASRVLPVGSFGAGYLNGKRESEGKDEIKSLKWGTRLAPALISAPVLIAERGASVGGYKKLKNLGLSKEDLKNSKKFLTGAWLDYAKTPVITTGLNEAGYQTGRYLGKKRNKKEKD